MSARPFLKWVGGKTQLLFELMTVFPKEVGTYYEPFIGGGAVFFALRARSWFSKAVINDWNSELVDTYTTIREETEELIEILNRWTEVYQRDPKGFFLEIRAKKPEFMVRVNRAARMILLNKTCYNGLYRVSKAGNFNSPFGDYENPLICDESNLRACAQALAGDVTIRQGDFAQAVEGAVKGDLVYFDPPYVPLTETSNFTSYTAVGFTAEDQRRLADTFRDLAQRGVSVVLSNSDTPLIRDLYKDFTIRKVGARRAINNVATQRGIVNEVLVTSFTEWWLDPMLPEDDQVSSIESS